MAEVAFVKTFLSSLDARPVKLSADHVEDAKNFPPRPPYILPRMPKPMSTRSPPSARQITVLLKSLRNPPLEISLPNLPLTTTSILDLKQHAARAADRPVEAVRILYQKRPVQDSKVLKDLLPEDDAATHIELSVMIVGQAPAPAAAAKNAAEEVGDAFWADLTGFLAQRLKSNERAEEMARVFRSTWTTQHS